ncbi:MAG: LytTR family DNA-binding domain-containing protein [Bacteroidota bacterium]
MKVSGLSTSYSHHFIVALIIGIWLSFFLVVFAPFDASDLSLPIRIILLPIYGLIASIGYMILIPAQNLIQKKTGQWNLMAEIVFIFIYNIVCLVGSYFYYTSEMINGTYTLFDFIFGQYYPIFLIMLPIIILMRWFLYKKKNYADSKTITIKGDNKLDFLTLEFTDLVCIRSADNYIEVNYIEDLQLKKKLLRSTLTSTHSEVPSLIQVHRSYLVNPTHLRSWKDSKTLNLTKMEVPVSKKYKDDVLSWNHSSLKSNISPQTP